MPSLLSQLSSLRSKNSPHSIADKNPSISSGNGSCGLPIELWEEIFNLLFVQIVDPSDLETELQDTVLTYSSVACESSLLSTVYQTQHPQLFATRRAIALVCKSWHWMMSPTLRSHIYINMSDDGAKMDRLYTVLDKTPDFAAAVIRLSIKQGTDYASYPPNPNFDQPRSRILTRILPLLTNLRILTCPIVLVQLLKGDLRPEVLIVGASLVISGPRYAPLFYQTNVWDHIHTLSLQLSEERGVYDESFTPARFLKLVNLRLEVQRFSAMEWIVSDWNIGKPRTLSIESPFPHSWLKLIHRHGQDLETLELIPLHDGQLYMYPPDPDISERTLELRKLKNLCLYHPSLTRISDPGAKLLSNLKASSLVRLCYHVISLKSRRQEFYRIAERVEAALKI